MRAVTLGEEPPTVLVGQSDAQLGVPPIDTQSLHLKQKRHLSTRLASMEYPN